MAIMALVIATLVPLVVLYIVYTLDLYGTGAFRNIALAFVWGGISVALAGQRAAARGRGEGEA